MSLLAPSQLPSQRGETWNDTDAIARHRALTMAERWALTVDASRAALQFAEGRRVSRADAQVRA